MKFYSTNNKNQKVSLREAVIQGLAPDNGLYMPEEINALPPSFFKSLTEMTFQEIGVHVAAAIVQDEVPADDLKKIVYNTIQFEAPVVEVEKDTHILELFHGPTAAFKDFGARFLSGLLGYFAQKQNKEITILVATSGDTGSAVANGFLDVPNVKVIVLYPSGKVSDIQEKQFTTLGKNITALEVEGTFDDCQRLVKQAFLDEELRKKLFLTSANSINIARLIPQSFYYFQAYAQLKDKSKPAVFVVPSGNFGNLTAGLLAKRMGLPVHHFIAATNDNDVVPQYLETGVFQARPSVSTISNAMDVGNPSNFARMLDLYNGQLDRLKQDITGYHFNDAETRETMADVLKRTGYTLDPHGAVGYRAWKAYQQRDTTVQGVILETAHPAKFREVVEQTLHVSVAVPDTLMRFLKGEKKTIAMSKEFDDFKEYLLSR